MHTFKKLLFIALCFFQVATLGGFCSPCPPNSTPPAYEVESSATKCCSEFLCPCPEYLDNAKLSKDSTGKKVVTSNHQYTALLTAPDFGSTLPHSVQHARFELIPIYIWTQTLLI